jgi:replicative DNA helicase
MDGMTQPATLCNLEAEQAFLGSCLMETEMLGRMDSTLKAEDFYLPAHQVIFEAMCRLRADDKPTDMVLLCDELGDTGLAAVDPNQGAAYIAALPGLVAVPWDGPYYADVVLNHSRLRMVVEMAEGLRQPGEDADAAIARAEAIIDTAKRKRTVVDWEHKDESLDRLLGRLSGPATEEDSGLSSGIQPLDSLLKGLKRGDLILIGARPSVGKTSLLATIAHFIGLRSGEPVTVFSVEMLRDRIWEKLLAIELDWTWDKVTGHSFTDRERGDLEGAVALLKAAPIDVVPAQEWTVEQIRSSMRKLAERRRPGLVAVDYLQLIEAEGKFESRVQIVATISKNLKRMALELECPVIVASQLNREQADRPDKEPRLEDLKESGAQEQDADVVILLHRPIKKEDKDKPLPDVIPTVAHVAKNRLGKQGKVKIGFRGAHHQFVALEERHIEYRDSGRY